MRNANEFMIKAVYCCYTLIDIFKHNKTFCRAKKMDRIKYNSS